MLKCQLCSVQTQAADWVGSSSVRPITHDRMSPLCHVDSNLVLPSGFKLHFNRGPMRRPLQDLDMSHCSLAARAIARGIAKMHSILSEVRLYRVLIVNRLSLNNCQIGPACSMLSELLLQVMFGRFRLGKDQ